MKHIAYIVIAILILGACRPNDKKRVVNFVETHEISVVEVKGCEYILWRASNGRAGDIEHYKGCDNPKHKNK